MKLWNDHLFLFANMSELLKNRQKVVLPPTGSEPPALAHQNPLNKVKKKQAAWKGQDPEEPWKPHDWLLNYEKTVCTTLDLSRQHNRNE